jgi:hypothetical protein
MIFKNTTVSLNGKILPASTASLSQSTDLTKIEELGRHAVYSSNGQRPQGKFSSSYYLTKLPIDASGIAGVIQVSGSVGPYSFTKGFLSEYSFSIEPERLIMANISVDFYSDISSGTQRAYNAADFENTFSHGGKSTITSSEFQSSPLSVDYSLSQKIEPTFGLGGNDIINAKQTDGRISITIKGTGLQKAIYENCDNTIGISLNLSDLCSNIVGTINEVGLKVVSSSLSLNKDEDLVGSIELVKFF